ncbi:MAG: hypothetical protein IKE70_02610 [Bacilli bacterium]|nr:hypothetical protein [Bacilli bacterium]
MNKFYEKGKSEKDDEILENIYQTDKTVKNLYPISEDKDYKDYLIGKETIVKIPKNSKGKKYWILSPQLVSKEEKSIELIEVDQKKANITFSIVKDEIIIPLITSTFDTITNTWDVRLPLYDKNIPSNLDNSLKTIEHEKIVRNDGILYSETFKTMISDINQLYQKGINYNK